MTDATRTTSHDTSAASSAGVVGAEPGRGGGRPARLVILVSGTGSNLVALLRACEDPAYGAEVVRVVADKPCPGVEHAREAGVPVAVIAPRDFADRRSWDEALAEEIAAAEPDLVVCAGFMRILGEPVLTRLEGRVLNTHPSLLPSFPGAHAVRDALAAGASGVAVMGAVMRAADPAAEVARLLKVLR